MAKTTHATAHKVALITGGASGIGRAFGKNLARRGMTVVLADRQREAAEAAAAGIRGAGGAAQAVALDVRDRAAFAEVARQVVSEHGSIDYLFNNAGIGVGGAMADFAPEDWDDVLDVNLRGVVHGVEAVYPLMITQGSGHIVNTGSVAGLMPMANEGSYTAAKHGVVGLSKSLRVEARQHGVTVTALCPGVIDTPILRGGAFGRIRIPGMTPEKLEEAWAKTRPMNVDEFAEKALARILRGDFVVIVPSWWRLVWLFDRIAPNLSLRLWSKIHDQLHEELAEERARPGAETTTITDQPSAASEHAS
jgi:NAD(P)-dependent dehydrogenase (short-subunit alcohol dehydrogenase family)